MHASRRIGFGRRPHAAGLAFVTTLAAYVIVVLAAAPQAQQAPAFTPVGSAAPPSAPASAPVIRDADGGEIDLLVGRSTVLNVGSTIARVSLTVPDVADALVTAPSQLLVHGKAPGTISLFVWDKLGAIKTFEVRVRRDLSALSAHLRQLFPAEQITVLGSGKDVIISGTVSGQYVVEKAAEVAGGYVEKKENVVNLLKQQEGVASNQVMLRVRFAEVSRSAVTALGANLFTGPGGFHDYIARSTTQQFAAPNYDEMVRSSIQGPDNWGGGRDTVDATGGKYSLSDFLNLFVFNNRYNVGAVVKALSEKGLFQSLAEPNLIATNGKEASFLAGGEFPYPVVQGGGANQSVTIQFKEFGVRLNFTPTVLGGDLIHLKVRPEVSALDFANGVTVEGFRVPALSTRRTETEVELRDGQTFAIAGLLNNTAADTMRKIPGIGDIPILGWLFKSRAIQKNQTELVVMITPQIIRRGQPGVSEGLPSLVEPYLGRPERSVPNPDAYIGSPRYPATEPARQDGGPASQPAPAAPMPTQPERAPMSEPSPVVPTPSRPITDRQVQLPQAPPAADPRQTASPVIADTTSERLAMPVYAMPMPTPADLGGMSPAPIPVAAPAAAPVPEPRELSGDIEAHAKAAEAARKQAEKDAEAAAQVKEAERKRVAKEQEEAAKREQERLRASAEAAKKQAEIDKKKADEEAKRREEIDAASARLKAAQQAYQAELEKARPGKGGSGSR
jgi:pilus assembly protein CpaC